MYISVFLPALICLAFFNSEAARPSAKIVNGSEADIKDFPYQLAVSALGSIHVCGASLIAPNVALCAAHCVVWFPGFLYSLLRVRAGSSNRKTGGQLVNVSKIYKHPKFNLSTYDYDVSILMLEEDITVLNSAIVQIVESGTSVEEGQIANVSGWGLLKEDDLLQPDILHSVEVPIVNHDGCNQTLDGRVTERMICAGGEGKDTCIGDSGGPLVIDGKLTGIVSWGVGCGRSGYPKTFTGIGNREIRQYIKDISGV